MEVKSGSGRKPETELAWVEAGRGLVWVQLEGMGLPMGPPARGLSGVIGVAVVRVVRARVRRVVESCIFGGRVD